MENVYDKTTLEPDWVEEEDMKSFISEFNRSSLETGFVFRDGFPETEPVDGKHCAAEGWSFIETKWFLAIDRFASLVKTIYPEFSGAGEDTYKFLDKRTSVLNESDDAIFFDVKWVRKNERELYASSMLIVSPDVAARVGSETDDYWIERMRKPN